MKRLLAILLSGAMALALLAAPASMLNADSDAPCAAANLNEALNVPGGTLDFTNDAEYPWVVDGNAARSGNSGVPSSRSSVSTTVNIAAGDVLTFDFWSRGEGNANGLGFVWDGFQLRIDGELIEEWGERAGWESYKMQLPHGVHELEFSYKKDADTDAAGDCAYLDNVYIGAPVLPQSISVPAITVPVGRPQQAVYTVLPENSFDTSVSFSIADTSVATVNELGVVRGVAVGTTTLTVTSFANPAVSQTAAVTVVDAPPAAELRGISVYDMSGAYTGQWISFPDYDPAEVTPLTPMTSVAGQSFAAAYAGGFVYGYIFAQMGDDTRMYVMNPETYQLTYPGGSCADGVFSMAYDHSRDKMYALCGRTGDEAPRYLGIVDLSTGSVERVAAFTGVTSNIMTIAIDGEGNAYGLTSDPSNALFVSIDLDTAACTVIGGTGVGLQFFQDMVWDHNTNQLFWAQYTASYDNGLYTIDPQTGAASFIGLIGSDGHELCCLYTVDDLPIGPIDGADVTVTFIDGVDGSSLGAVTVTAGSVLDSADFPQTIEHEGREYLGWDYNGAPVYNDLTVTAKYNDPLAIIWDFETDPAMQGFEFVDEDGDDLTWSWSYNEAYMIYYDGVGCAASYSFGAGAGAFGTDNWLITPEFSGTSIKFFVNGQDPDVFMEPFGVYASTDGGQTWSDELAYFIATHEPEEKTIYLNQYAGQSIRIAIRHYTDERYFRLNVDHIVAEGVLEAGSILGDADLTGSVTVTDAMLILRHAMNLSPLTGRALAVSDYNRDGRVTVEDALLVMRAAMGLLG